MSRKIITEQMNGLCEKLHQKFNLEMQEILNHLREVFSEGKINQVVALGVGSLNEKISFHQACLLTNIVDELSSVSSKHWHELLAEQSEVNFLQEIGWNVKGKQELTLDVFSGDNIDFDQITLYYMPRPDYKLLDSVIEKLVDVGKLEKAIFWTANFFLRIESSDDDEYQPPIQGFLTSQPYLISYIAECAFKEVSDFGGILGLGSAILHCKDEIAFYVPTMLEDLTREVSKLKMKVAELESNESTLKNEVSKLKMRVAELESNESKLKMRVAELESNESKLKMRVAELESNESTLKNEVSNLKMKVSALEINKSVMQERVSELDQTDEDSENSFDAHSTLSYDADCILQLDGKPVRVNKAYLSTHSVVFKNMFKDDVDKKEYDIKDVTYEEFTELLKVIYPVRKPITDRNVESLLKLGHRFGMADMLIVCQNFLLRNPNLVSLARRTWMAQEYGLERLLTSSAKAPDL